MNRLASSAAAFAMILFSVLAEAQQENRIGDAIIQYDPDTGQIIVITDDETNRNIETVINSLDIPVPQVLIKVLFLEITHSDDLDLGVEGFFQFNGAGDPNQVDTAFGIAGQTFGGFARIIENDLNITLRALSEVGKLEVLSRPSILVRNNETGLITIGKEVPFIRNTRVTQFGEIINTVEYEDIGIILEVTPHITQDRMVEMLVRPEISTLTGETVSISLGVDAPVFAKRSAETRVVVPDRHTVVIGGLMEDQKTETTRKVPILGDIPLIGMAFRRKITTESKTELLIFLTPYVIENISELDDMSVSERSDTVLAPNVFTPEQLDRFIGDVGTTTESQPKQGPPAGSSEHTPGNKGVVYRTPGR